MKKTLLKVMIGCGLTLTAVQALGSKPYSLNNYKTLDAVVEVAQQESSQSVYTRAYGEKNADEKIRLLEAFIASPEWKGAKEQKNAYSELALVYYSPKGNYDKAMDNATKALSFSDLEAEYQVHMCLTLSACYALHPTKKDMAKGADFANKAFNIASANQNKVNPSYFDAAKQLKDAFAKDLSQKTKKAPVSVATPLDNALKLYKQKNYAAAADALSKLDQNDPKVDYYYGLSLSQIKQYDKAINHLLEASIASPAEYPKARGLAHDFFLANVYKDQKSGKGYNALITDSNTKLVRQ